MSELVSSQGYINFADGETEKEIIFDKAVSYLNLTIRGDCYVILNDNVDDKIYVPLDLGQPLIFDEIPITKFKITRTDLLTLLSFTYFGFFLNSVEDLSINVDELTLCKLILGYTDTTHDLLLNFYISKAQNTIKRYCNIDDLIGLDNQVVELAIYYYQNKNNVGIKQMTEGSRSQTLTDGIPQSIKDILPLPCIRLL